MGAVRIATGDAAQAAGPLVMVAGSGGEYGGRIELLGGSSAYGPGASACAQSGKGTTKSGRMSAVTSNPHIRRDQLRANRDVQLLGLLA